MFITNVSISAGAVLVPAGTEKAIGLISPGYLKDPTDAVFNTDPGIQEWRAFMAKYLRDSNASDCIMLSAMANLKR